MDTHNLSPLFYALTYTSLPVRKLARASTEHTDATAKSDKKEASQVLCPLEQSAWQTAPQTSVSLRAGDDLSLLRTHSYHPAQTLRRKLHHVPGLETVRHEQSKSGVPEGYRRGEGMLELDNLEWVSAKRAACQSGSRTPSPRGDGMRTTQPTYVPIN